MCQSFSSITALLLYLPNKKCQQFKIIWVVTNVSKRSIIDNFFDLCEYYRQLKVCQNWVFDYAEHDVFGCSYYSSPYSSHIRSSGWIEMLSDLFVRWIFVDSLHFHAQFACIMYLLILLLIFPLKSNLFFNVRQNILQS